MVDDCYWRLDFIQSKVSCLKFIFHVHNNPNEMWEFKHKHSFRWIVDPNWERRRLKLQSWMKHGLYYFIRLPRKTNILFSRNLEKFDTFDTLEIVSIPIDEIFIIIIIQRASDCHWTWKRIISCGIFICSKFIFIVKLNAVNGMLNTWLKMGRGVAGSGLSHKLINAHCSYKDIENHRREFESTKHSYNGRSDFNCWNSICKKIIM